MNTPRMVAGTLLFLVLTMNAFGQSPRPTAKGITQVPGIRVGHFTLPGGLTGLRP